MGMGEGFIKDFQISASSEFEGFPAVNVRPRKSGWCAKSIDVHPYIQVQLDTVSSKSIPEIQIYHIYKL